MSKELEKILREITEYDLDALLASLNDPPIEVLLKDLQDSTEQLLKNLGNDQTHKCVAQLSEYPFFQVVCPPLQSLSTFSPRLVRVSASPYGLKPKETGQPHLEPDQPGAPLGVTVSGGWVMTQPRSLAVLGERKPRESQGWQIASKKRYGII